ncbi:hypothetical protein K435DRAFT_866869 [Dendrothele bispora CBS 962.96]|uniref:Uncharacterized protein n=1 Tax=Dendrothele bispora (strain CBS 962.96) TaxID=1314807 RepID=A0A4S8LFS2_DENBC|nr:hypothetical protein K435DRAFT_866869 [Dendrothele bispora CBS 962.96]
MGRGKGPMWAYFWQGKTAISVHFRAHCLGCIRRHMSKPEPTDADTLKLEDDTSFKAACEKAGSVLGTKAAMVVHILGGEKACRNVSAAAVAKAKELWKKEQKKKRTRGGEDGFIRKKTYRPGTVKGKKIENPGTPGTL